MTNRRWYLVKVLPSTAEYVGGIDVDEIVCKLARAEVGQAISEIKDEEGPRLEPEGELERGMDLLSEMPRR